MTEAAKYVVVPVEPSPAKLEAMAFNMSAEFGPEFVKPLGAFAKSLYREITSGAPAARPAAPSREAVARSIYTTACESYKAVPSWDREHAEVKDLHRAQADAILALFAAQGEAKAVEALAKEERAHLQTVDERDAYHEWADKLAHAIGGDGIGEHSNQNNPWANALEVAVALHALTTPPDTAALLEKADKALETLVATVGAMRVPLTTAVARQIALEMGPALMSAQEALSDIRKARS